MEKYKELYELISHSASFDEVRASGLLPEPDSDDGYYFVSYSHKDFKPVISDILALRESGALIWYDRGLESGKSWIREVRQKMSSFYCKGVIVYLSKNYLESYSCMLELDHLLSATGKSAMFILLDSSVSANAAEILMYATLHSLTMASNGMLLAGELFKNHPLLLATDTVERKLAALEKFTPPELIEYTYLYGVKDIAHRVTDFIIGRCASVSGIADKNVRRVEIPSFVTHGGKRYRVAQISPSAFSQCDMLEEVVVSDGWMSIDQHAFIRCPSLRRVVLGKPRNIFFTRTGVVHDIFDRCPNARIEAEGLIRYRSAFKGREDITVATHGKDESWYGECFAGCTNLVRAELGRGDDFSDRMFSGCTSLREISIPDGNFTPRMYRSFEGCVSLESIRLPKRISLIGERSFFGCRSLTEIEIPRRVTRIARDAFSGCDGIHTVTLNSRKLRNFINMPYNRSILLDELFPSAEKFYVLHPPKNTRMFRGEITELPSDKKGYRLFVRRTDGE